MWVGRLRALFASPAVTPYNRSFAWEVTKRMPALTLQLCCVGYLIHDYVVEVLPSEGASMLPTLAISDDFLYSVRMPFYKLLNRPLSSYLGPSISPSQYKSDQSMGTGLAVGDIIAAKSPLDPAISVSKRIIGLPGDTILVDPRPEPSSTHEKDWKTFNRGIDTRRQSNSPPDIQSIRDQPVYVVVPKGHVWLAGDNLSNSTDSRNYGPVPLAMIEGKVVGKAIYMSLPTWQRLKNGLQKV